MNLALFDLDNTLLSCDSDFEWAQFLIEKGVLDPEVHAAKNEHFYAQYRAGTLDIHEFLDFQLHPLSRHPRAQLDELRRISRYPKLKPILPNHRIGTMINNLNRAIGRGIFLCVLKQVHENLFEEHWIDRQKRNVSRDRNAYAALAELLLKPR